MSGHLLCLRVVCFTGVPLTSRSTESHGPEFSTSGPKFRVGMVEDRYTETLFYEGIGTQKHTYVKCSS